MFLSSAKRLGTRWYSRRLALKSESLTGLTAFPFNNNYHSRGRETTTSSSESKKLSTFGCFPVASEQAQKRFMSSDIGKIGGHLILENENDNENDDDTTTEILAKESDDEKDESPLVSVIQQEDGTNEEHQNEVVIPEEEDDDDDDDDDDEGEEEEEENDNTNESLQHEDEDEESDIENEEQDDDNPDDQTLIGRARTLLRKPGGTYAESEELCNEAMEVIQQLAGVGSVGSVKKSFDLLIRLADEGVPPTLDSGSTNSLLRNWAMCYGQRGEGPTNIGAIADLLKREVLTPDDLTFNIILDYEGAGAKKLQLDTAVSSVRRAWETLTDNYKGNDPMRHSLNECAENVLVQVLARHGHLGKAMEMAKDLIELKDTEDSTRQRMYDETFMSILIAAIDCPIEERPQVIEFLTWAGEQYESDANQIDVKVESIYLFGWAVQTKPDQGEEMPEWILESIGWIGKYVSGDCGGTDDNAKAIRLWASAGHVWTAKALLDLMFQKWQEGATTVVPNLLCYNTVLASVEQLDVGRMPMDLLAQMMDHSSGGLVPNYLSYKLAIDYLTRSDDLEDTLEAERIVRELTDASKGEELSKRAPDQDLFVSVAKGLAKHQDLGHLEEYLNWLEREYEEGNFAALLPRHFFDELLLEWDRSGAPRPSETAMSILERTHRLGLLDNRSGQLFQRAAIMISKSEGHTVGSQIEKVISIFEEVIPVWQLASQPVYLRAIDHFAAEGEAEKVEWCVTQRYEAHLCRKGLSQPSTYDFNVVLKAWSNSAAPRAAERADAIVQNMERLDGGKLQNCKPNKESYKCLLRCWNKSGLPQAKKRQEEIKVEIKGF